MRRYWIFAVFLVRGISLAHAQEPTNTGVSNSGGWQVGSIIGLQAN